MDPPGSSVEVLTAKVLEGLNHNQRKAATFPANGRLQIIAGPGTGKTKVLVARVAYLLLNEGIPPQNIIVTTFTKKAANEMTERLYQVLKHTSIEIGKLLIGTFHSICFRIIKMYGKKLGLEEHNIADERDSTQILKEVLSGLSGSELTYLRGLPSDEVKLFINERESKTNGYDWKKLKRQISKLKSSGILAKDYSRSVKANKCLSLIYDKYQARLTNEKLLDFDDCLLYCHLLVESSSVLNFVRHVLVDEFQDTNEIQLRLMYQFARGHPTNSTYQHNVTIVGDPDQSIYAFRDAQSINFEKMMSHYNNKCDMITLDENYRSTSDILRISENIMRQQNNRIVKTLKSQHQTTFRPVYANVKSADQEARWIAYQIEHLQTLPESPIKYSDIAILVRTAYQTRAIENELVRKRIPYFMVRGKAFWDRKEVLAMMDYLRIVAHDNDRIAILRTLNYPKRGLGDKTLSAIESMLEVALVSNQSLISKLQMLASIDNKEIKLTKKNKDSILEYLKIIELAREQVKLIDSGDNTEENLNKVFDYIYTQSGLKKEFSEDANMGLNIDEVKKQFCEFVPQNEELPLFIGGTEDDISKDGRNFVARFIHSVGLYETDAKTAEQQKEVKSRGKVSISTIHGSKGLEWPIVFVPGLSEDLLPAKFALDSGGEDAVDEERRCFYVATTRAKTLLYLSSYTEDDYGGGWGRRPIVSESRFIQKISQTTQISGYQDAFANWENLNRLFQLLGKELPSPKVFNLQHFEALYKNRMKAYLRGETMEISPEHFSGSNEGKPSNFNGLGFTSAKIEMGRKREAPVPKRKPFKAPRIEANSGISYQVNKKAPLNPVNASVGSNVKRAPPYIPTRKAPTYIPNRKKGI